MSEEEGKRRRKGKEKERLNHGGASRGKGVREMSAADDGNSSRKPNGSAVVRPAPREGLNAGLVIPQIV